MHQIEVLKQKLHQAEWEVINIKRIIENEEVKALESFKKRHNLVTDWEMGLFSCLDNIVLNQILNLVKIRDAIFLNKTFLNYMRSDDLLRPLFWDAIASHHILKHNVSFLLKTIRPYTFYKWISFMKTGKFFLPNFGPLPIKYGDNMTILIANARYLLTATMRPIVKCEKEACDDGYFMDEFYPLGSETYSGVIYDGNVVIIANKMICMKGDHLIVFNGFRRKHPYFSMWEIANRCPVIRRKYAKLLKNGKIKFSDMKTKIEKLMEFTKQSSYKKAIDEWMETGVIDGEIH